MELLHPVFLIFGTALFAAVTIGVNVINRREMRRRRSLSIEEQRHIAANEEAERQTFSLGILDLPYPTVLG